jgi:hypothetical protein
MRSSHVALGAVAVVAAGLAVVFAALYVTKDSGNGTAEACGDRSYGHISALEPRDNGYELRFDPAWFTSGVTANTAAAEDGVVEPGEPVPNDNYRIEEGHRLLTYVVPEEAAVTVLTRQGEGQFGPTPVTVEELAQLVEGEEPVELFEPLGTGVWIRYEIDTVCAVDQQYLP